MPAIYGPGETTPRALPNFLRAAAEGAAPTIFGDGEDLRDQIHARDAAAAVRLALGGTASGTFNVADGQRHSIAEIARLACGVAGLGVAPISRERQKPRRDFHMSTARAERTLGFAPAVRLEDGMREQLAWLRSIGRRGLENGALRRRRLRLQRGRGRRRGGRAHVRYRRLKMIAYSFS
jgi:nucleoside-diphosphate-sugar epimerase